MIITIKTLVFKLHHFIKSGTPNKVTYNSILLVFDLLFQFIIQRSKETIYVPLKRFILKTIKWNTII